MKVIAYNPNSAFSILSAVLEDSMLSEETSFGQNIMVHIENPMEFYLEHQKGLRWVSRETIQLLVSDTKEYVSIRDAIVDKHSDLTIDDVLCLHGLMSGMDGAKRELVKHSKTLINKNASNEKEYFLNDINQKNKKIEELRAKLKSQNRRLRESLKNAANLEDLTSDLTDEIKVLREENVSKDRKIKRLDKMKKELEVNWKQSEREINRLKGQIQAKDRQILNHSK